MYQILCLRCHLQSERCRRLQETLKQLQKQMLQRTCRAPSKPRRSYWCCGSCYTDTSMKITSLAALWKPDFSNLFGSNCSLPVSSMSKQHGQLWQAFLRHVRQDCSMNFANQTATAARAESICPSAGLDAWL